MCYIIVYGTGQPRLSLFYSGERAMTARLLTTSTTSTTLTTNNDITNRDLLRERRYLMQNLCEVPLDPEANASASGFVQGESGSVIPPEWAFVKLDLFDNTPAQELAQGRRRLKLALGILHARTEQWMYFRSSLNGPWRNVKRGLHLDDPEDRAHYELIESTREQYVDAGLVPRCSKFYRRGRQRKGQTTVGLSCVVAELPRAGQYLVTMIYDQLVLVYELDNATLTPKQRQSGVIATNTQRSGNRVRARDLFR